MVPMTTQCEDAPCCGCCGTNIYGVDQEADYGYWDDLEDYHDEDE